MMNEIEQHKQNLIKGLEAGSLSLIQRSIDELNQTDIKLITIDKGDLNNKEDDRDIDISNLVIKFSLALTGFKNTKVSFSRCKFHKKLTLQELSCSNQIRFEDCQFRESLELINNNCNSVNLLGNSFSSQDICFEHFDSPTSISFQANTSVKKVSFVDMELQSLNFVTNSGKTSYRGQDALDCSEIHFINANAKHLTLNQFIQVQSKVLFEDSTIENLSLSNIKTINQNAIDLSFKENFFQSLSVQSTRANDLTLDGNRFKKVIDINLEANRTYIKNIEGADSSESTLKIGNSHKNFRLENCSNLKGLTFSKNFSSINDVCISRLNAETLEFSDSSSNASYNFNVLLSNLSKTDSLLKRCKEPIKLCFNRIKFFKNLHIKDSVIGENEWTQCKFNRNIDFSRVFFHVVPKLHNENFAETCHVNFVTCDFKDFEHSDAESSYRSLKSQSIKTNYDYGEHLFTSLELRSRLSKFKPYQIERIIGMFGWSFNRLGESIIRPFIWWICSFLLFALICYFTNAIEVVNPTKTQLKIYNSTWLNFLTLDPSAKESFFCFSYEVKNFWMSLSYSLMNSIIIFKIAAVSKFLYPKYPTIFFLGFFQSILSSILIYLFVIGIKKRFRQK